jgi:hypothetical protein
MTSITFIHSEGRVTIPARQAINKCNLFRNNPRRRVSPYRVQSRVSLSIFREFISALEGNSVKITSINFAGLTRLCEEFGFTELSSKLSRFVQQFEASNYSEYSEYEEETEETEETEEFEEPQTKSRFPEVRNRFLKESFQFIVNGSTIESEISIAASLFPRIREQLSVDGCARKFFVNDNRIKSTDIRSLELLLSGEIPSKEGFLISFFGNDTFDRLFLGKSSQMTNLFELMEENRIDLESFDVSVVSIEMLDSLLLNEFVKVESEDSLLDFIWNLGADYRDLLRHIQFEFLSEEGVSLLDKVFGLPPESVWEFAIERITCPPLRLNSRILSEFPEFPKIFAEFRKNQISLLWRGSRDGFGASEFHGRCDGHADTLTVILDTKGNVFGGFTPVEWESRVWNGKQFDKSNTLKADESQKSFVFSLKNPCNFRAKKFVLNTQEKYRAISCDSKWGPFFSGGFGVSDNCNTNMESRSGMFGLCYVNDTGLTGQTFLTGWKNFQVREIEVFEIAN